MADRGCEACMYAWSLWDDIIKKTGDPVYGLMASRAFEMLDWVEAFETPPDQITAEDWEYMREVKAVRKMIEVQEAQQAQANQTTTACQPDAE